MDYMDNLKQHLEGKRLVGVGVTGFMRIIPALLGVDDYSIVQYASLKNNEGKILESMCDIFSFRDAGINLSQKNTLAILKQSFIEGVIKNDDIIFLYKNSYSTEKILKSHGVQFVGNKANVREKYEDKYFFRKIMIEEGLPYFPGVSFSYEQLLKNTYATISQQLGDARVMQSNSVKIGGGKGTFFVCNEGDYEEALVYLAGRKDAESSFVNCTKYVDGMSASIYGCITKKGILSTSIQVQLVDCYELLEKKKGRGNFCGHSFNDNHFTETAKSKAIKIVEKLGERMKKDGYVGLFGIDLLVSGDDVYLVECNARYTGAFPMISMVDLTNNIIPLDYFDIITHIGGDSGVDETVAGENLKYSRGASSLVLSHRAEHKTLLIKTINPGVYKYDQGKIVFVRSGYTYSDLQNEGEFLLVNIPLQQGDEIDSESKLKRIGHLILGDDCYDKKSKGLNKHTAMLVDAVYAEFTQEM